MRFEFALLITAAALALVSACSTKTDTPATPTPSEAPADATIAPAQAEPMGEAIGHFHPKGKAPSKHTIAALEKAGGTLPLSDRRDFEEQAKGFIAAPDYKKIMADAGNVAWDMERYDWLVEGEDFESIHPSTERQSKLNMNYGLYEV
ncbi:MAG: hypothetical protein WBM47_02585, partial [Polyangiales bacterium]